MTHTLREIPDRIRARQIIKGNSIGAHPGAPDCRGHLPEPFRAELDRAARAGVVSYVVYSYATPIAWELTTGAVIIPDIRYSVTTSRHQAVACRGFGVPTLDVGAVRLLTDVALAEVSVSA